MTKNRNDLAKDALMAVATAKLTAHYIKETSRPKQDLMPLGEMFRNYGLFLGTFELLFRLAQVLLVLEIILGVLWLPRGIPFISHSSFALSYVSYGVAFNNMVLGWLGIHL